MRSDGLNYMSSGPTAKGRLVAVVLGIVLGTGATAYLMRDFELVKRLDDPSKNESRPFRVSFKPSEPLKLKPEAQEKLEKAQAEKAEAKEK